LQPSVPKRVQDWGCSRFESDRKIRQEARRSEEDESLLDVTFNALDFLADDVESDGLGNWSALANGDDITDLEAEGWRAVSGEGLMALLETIVLFDVMEIVASDDNSASHLGRNNDTPNQAIIINKYTNKEKATNAATRLDCGARPFILTYLKILPLMLTSPVNGHFWSM